MLNALADTNYFSNAQIGNVSNLDPKLILQLNSTTQGSLFAPKMTTAQRLLITPPIPGGTVVFDTDLNAYMGWNSLNLTWKAIGGGAASLSNWTPTTVYKIGDSVVSQADSNDVFRSLTDHTSSASFNADRLANNWEKISPTYFKLFVPGTQYFTGDLIKTFDEQLFLARINFIADVDPVVDISLRNMEFRSPNDLTTAPLRGGVVTYGAPNYNVTAGNGVIVTNGGTPFSQVNPVTWNAAVLTMPNPTGYNTIQVSGTGVVSAVSGISGALASKQNMVLAVVFAPNNEIMPIGTATVDHGNDMRTLSIMIGIVRNGVIFTGNPNQTFLTTSGSLFFNGLGKGTETPNVKSCPAQPVTSFRLYDRDSDLGVTTTIPNAQYDVGGVLTAIPGTNWTYFKIYLAPNCNIILQYGQDTAPTKNEIIALQDVNIDAYIPNPQLQGIVKFVGIVYFQKANLNFASNVTTQWVNSGLFGMGVSGSGSSITATGDILGPAVSIDNHPMLFDGTTGKLAKDSSFTTFNTDGSVLFQGGNSQLTVDRPTGSLNLRHNGMTFADIASTFSLSILPAPVPTGNQTITFPPNPPLANQILKSDAFGQLSWVPGGSLTNWQGTHDYVLGETVVSPTDSNDIFRALLAHTSTASFDADRLAGNWEIISPSHFIPFTPAQQYFVGDLIRTQDGGIWRATSNFIASATATIDVAAGRMEIMSPVDYTTSLTSGGAVTFAAPNYQIAAGTGLIVTNAGTPFSSFQNVNWNATNIPEPLPNPGGVNTISVNSAGIVSVSTGLDSPLSAKTSITLANIFAPTRTITPRNGPATDHGNSIRSLSVLMGMLKDKIEFTGNADNTFQTKAGSIYFDGIAPGTEQPNIINCPVQLITNFNYYDQDTTISTNQTLLDTYNYDLGGIMTGIPVGNWSYSKIFLSPNCRVYVQHGQQFAATEAAIIAAEESGRSSYVTNPALTIGVKFVGIVFFQAQTNVLTEGPFVTWVNSGLFGIGVAGSGSTVTTNGDVFGPASSVDRAIAVFSGGGGKTLIDTPPTIDSTGSIAGVQNLSVKGLNTNPQSALNLSAVNFATGRSGTGALSAGQTSADVSFGFGANGDWRHFIATYHDGGAALVKNNQFRFYVQNSTTSTDSIAPNGTGNAMAMAITPVGTGILTTDPFTALDVVGDIITSFHGNTSPHNVAEVGTRAIGHVSGNSFTNQVAGMKVEIKAVESSHLTTKPAMANNSDILWTTWGNSLWNTKEVMRLTARGRLGINTNTPQALLHVNGQSIFGTVQAAADVANAGVARVTVTGPNGNANGPHNSWNNDSDPYPVRHFLNWTHDNIWDCWDCYYGYDAGGANINLRGSNTSSAFRWTKTATDLILGVNAAPTAGGVITTTNKFWLNETGTVNVADILVAGPGGVDILGNGTLNRLGQESIRMQNAPVWTYGGFAGIGNNPMPLPAGSNGLRQANANFAGGNGCCVYTPAIRAAGSPFYVYVESTWGTAVGGDRTNHPGINQSVPTGWVATYISNGTTWEYQGKTTTTEFNAGLTYITSTTNPGKGNAGNYLRSSGNGQLYWSATVVADEALSAEVASQKKQINDLIKRIKKLEAK